MKRMIAWALCLAALSLASRGKIVGGVETEPGEFPYMVSIQINSHFCGGSLIAPNYVLTAAHCIFTSSLPGRGRVVVGLHKLSDAAPEVFKIKRAIKHPKYQQRNSYDYDFALIELDGVSRFEPAILDGREVHDIIPEGMMSTTIGWGDTAEGGSLSDVLLKVDIPIVTQAECTKAYPKDILDTMLCAGLDKGGKDSCQGDSGGPLLVETDHGKVQVGVVSWGQGCARPMKYGVYSRVSSAIEWIESVISP